MKLQLLTLVFALGVFAINEDALLKQVLNAAIYETLLDKTGTISFSRVHEKWYAGTGTTYPYPTSTDACAKQEWPTEEQVKAYPNTMRQALDTSRLVFGAPFPDPPDRFNCVINTTVANLKLYTCEGYDIDLAQKLVDRINFHYGSKIQLFWQYSEWMEDANKYNNIVSHLLGWQFDGIFASMTSTKTMTWPAPYELKTNVPRGSMVAFTCPYQAGGNSAAYGPRAAPAGVDFSTGASSLNNAGVLIAVEAGTAMDTWATKNAPLATVMRYTDGSLCKPLTRNGTVHVYLAPHLTIAYDIKQSNGTLHSVGALTSSIYSIGLRPTFSVWADPCRANLNCTACVTAVGCGWCSEQRACDNLYTTGCSASTVTVANTCPPNSAGYQLGLSLLALAAVALLLL